MAISLIFAIVPAMGAQPDSTGDNNPANFNKDKHNVTAKKAYEHANAHMISFLAANTPGLESWRGASVNPEPVVLYDINGKKLYYEFSVENETEMVGRMKVSANKVLGHSVKTFEIGPRLWNADAAMQKSIDVANEEYPDGKIKSTKMVVYDYPRIGAMTVVHDKTTGEKHRIFVDAYTLDVIPDKAPTETEEGVWSRYEQISKDKKSKNIARWKDSDDLAMSVEGEAASMDIDIQKPITKENLKKLEASPVNTMSMVATLDVPLYGQITSHACAVASAQMIAKYHGSWYSQSQISLFMGGCGIGGGCTSSEQLRFYKGELDKQGSSEDISYLDDAVFEIDRNRPFVSAIYSSPSTGHARVVRGYTLNSGGHDYLWINDPWPVNEGVTKWEDWDSVSHKYHLYVV